LSSASGPNLPQGLIEALREAQRVVALTGSGISAESGVPTFREVQTGLWERYDPQQPATPQAFARDPRLVWEWYEWRRRLVTEAEPNSGHRALAELERRIPEFTLVTQNVDGLPARACSRNVIELHGSILRSKCSRECVIVEP
jgi:NAD-dependent deacetylase